MLGRAYFELKDYGLAKQHFKLAISDLKKYGNQLNKQAEVHRSLGDIAFEESNPKENIAEIDAARKLISRYLKTVLPGLSPQEQQGYLLNNFYNEFLDSLSFGFHLKDNPRAAFASAEWLINGKGLSQEVAAETALLAAPETAPFVQDLRIVRNEIAGIWVRDPKMQREENRAQISELEAKEKTLQQEINNRTPNSDSGNSWVTVGELMSRLPQDAAIINIACIPIVDFDVSKEQEQSEIVDLDFHYVAWIIPHIANGSVQIVDLGPAEEIDKLLSDYKANIETEGASRSLGVPNTTNKANENKTKESSESLSKLLIASLEPHLDGITQIFISPDGALWQIPWDALLTSDGKFLIETYQTTYVISGRELAGKSVEASNLGKPVIFANPNYDLDVQQMEIRVDKDQAPTRASVGGYFGELPGTAKEADSIRPSIENFTNQSCDFLTWENAQEAKFKKLHRPRVLVLSTHGFYLDDESVDQMSLHNPLIRCGLALAGCNQRDEALRQNKEDGILTGLEIIGTDLRGTELVVLSACETAVGQAQDGEGVVGLRQAFQLAGAESVVASLWKVSDNETAELMTSFFSELSNGKAVATAFREAQLACIKVLRERNGYASPYYWAPFTLTGR